MASSASPSPSSVPRPSQAPSQAQAQATGPLRHATAGRDPRHEQHHTISNPLLLTQEVSATAIKKVDQSLGSITNETDRLPVAVQCVMCFCCWTFSGLREMMTTERTIDYALGFIIGESFGALVFSLVETVVLPLLFTIGALDHIQFQSGSGWVSLTNPSNETFLSADQAELGGAQVLRWQQFLTSLLSFIMVITSVMWIVRGLQAWKRGEDKEAADARLDSLLSHTKECAFCLERIPQQARRCKFCTSMVDHSDGGALGDSPRGSPLEALSVAGSPAPASQKTQRSVHFDDDTSPLRAPSVAGTPTPTPIPTPTQAEPRPPSLHELLRAVRSSTEQVQRNQDELLRAMEAFFESHRPRPPPPRQVFSTASPSPGSSPATPVTMTFF